MVQLSKRKICSGVVVINHTETIQIRVKRTGHVSTSEAAACIGVVSLVTDNNVTKVQLVVQIICPSPPEATNLPRNDAEHALPPNQNPQAGRLTARARMSKSRSSGK